MVERAESLRSFAGGGGDLLPHARLAASVETKPVTWLSKGRLAAGKITVLDGDPGLGKSIITVDWAARISTGRSLPGAAGWAEDAPTGLPRGVVMLSAEDDEADTIVPRLIAASANLKRVAFLKMTDGLGNEFLPLLGRHLDAIERQIEAVDAALLIIDPLMAFLDADINSNRDQDIRRLLSPLATMASRVECAILVLRHLNKSAGMASLYRGGGSIGIIGAARVGLLAAKDDEDETGQRRILAVQKCNIGPEMPSLMYRVVGTDDGETPKIEWLGETTKTATQLLGQVPDATDRDEMTDAELWLVDLLSQGAVDSAEVFRQGAKQGFAQKTLRRAKARIGAKPIRHGFGKDGTWQWHLSVDARRAPAGVDLTAKGQTADDIWDDAIDGQGTP